MCCITNNITLEKCHSWGKFKINFWYLVECWQRFHAFSNWRLRRKLLEKNANYRNVSSCRIQFEWQTRLRENHHQRSFLCHLHQSSLALNWNHLCDAKWILKCQTATVVIKKGRTFCESSNWIKLTKCCAKYIIWALVSIILENSSIIFIWYLRYSVWKMIARH